MARESKGQQIKTFKHYEPQPDLSMANKLKYGYDLAIKVLTDFCELHDCKTCGNSGFTGEHNYDGVCPICDGQSTYLSEFRNMAKFLEDNRPKDVQ